MVKKKKWNLIIWARGYHVARERFPISLSPCAPLDLRNYCFNSMIDFNSELDATVSCACKLTAMVGENALAREIRQYCQIQAGPWLPRHPCSSALPHFILHFPEICAGKKSRTGLLVVHKTPQFMANEKCWYARVWKLNWLKIHYSCFPRHYLFLLFFSLKGVISVYQSWNKMLTEFLGCSCCKETRWKA